MKCEHKGCENEVVGIVQGVNAIKEELTGEDGKFTLCLCELHKRAWEIGWEHAGRGLAIPFGTALLLAKKELGV